MAMHRGSWRAFFIAALAVTALLALQQPASSQARSDAIRQRLKTRPSDPTLYYYLSLAEGDKLPRIESPAGETIAGIDGLSVDGTTLIGIQNVTNPGRVIRVHLRADGKSADRIEPLLSHHHPAIDQPTTGVVVGRSFALLATTQVSRFTPQGRIESPETLKPPVILMISLGAKSGLGRG